MEKMKKNGCENVGVNFYEGVDKEVNAALIMDFEKEVKGKILEARKLVSRYAYRKLENHAHSVGMYHAVKEMVYTYLHGTVCVDYGNYFVKGCMDCLVEASVADPAYKALFTEEERSICRKILGYEKEYQAAKELFAA